MGYRSACYPLLSHVLHRTFLFSPVQADEDSSDTIRYRVIEARR